MRINRPHNATVMNLGTWARITNKSIYSYVNLTNTGLYTWNQKYRTTQCITILHTGTFSTIDCSLSPHCGATEYKKISSTFYGSEIGICLGAGIDNRRYFHQETDNHDIRLGQDWAYVVPVQLVNVSKHDLLFVMYILYNNNVWYLMHPDVLKQYPLYNYKDKLVFPDTLLITDGKACLPIIEHSRYPTKLGPYYSLESALENAAYWKMIVAPIETPSFCIDNYTCIHKGKIYVDFDSMLVRCNKAVQTNNLLPIGFSSIAKTAGHIVYTGLAAIWYFLVDVITWIVFWLFKYIDPFLAIVFMLINSYRYNKTFIDSIVYSLITSFFLTNIYNISSWRHDYGLLYD